MEAQGTHAWVWSLLACSTCSSGKDSIRTGKSASPPQNSKQEAQAAWTRDLGGHD